MLLGVQVTLTTEVTAHGQAQAEIASVKTAVQAAVTSPNLLGARSRPEVLQARPVLLSELTVLGIDVDDGWFGRQPFREGDPPLALVVLRGDFDTSQMWFAGGYRGQSPEVEARFSYGYIVYRLRPVEPVVWQLLGYDEELNRVLGGSTQ